MTRSQNQAFRSSLSTEESVLVFMIVFFFLTEFLWILSFCRKEISLGIYVCMIKGVLSCLVKSTHIPRSICNMFSGIVMEPHNTIFR